MKDHVRRPGHGWLIQCAFELAQVIRQHSWANAKVAELVCSHRNPARGAVTDIPYTGYRTRHVQAV